MLTNLIRYQHKWMPAFLAIVLIALPLAAQVTPIGAPGTLVASEETPAAATNADSLRKAAHNPVASLISVPVQDNFNFNISPGDRAQSVLNIQPVIPRRISDNWNLTTRVITLIIYQPLPPVEGQVTSQGVHGLGDINPTFFLSPSKASKVIWGVGPAFVLPTATSIYLGQGKWSMGPAIVVLTQPGPWSLGALVNNVWSYAGHADRQVVNQMNFQYFINYNLKKGYYITWQPTLTANWEASSPNRRTVPFGGGIGRIMKLGFSTRQSRASVLWQSRAPVGHVALRDAHADRVPVSQADQATAEDDDGEKAEATGPGAVTEELMEIQFLIESDFCESS